jgi:uncharacterized protein YcfJ
LGVTAGSVVPVIGTGIGAVVGGLTGALTGFFTGSEVGEVVGEELDRIVGTYSCNVCGNIFEE